MAAIPFNQSDSNYTLVCPLDDRQVQFYVRWNSRDQAYYFDMYDSDDSVICLNIKVVPGVSLGRRSQHEFFDTYILLGVDTTGRGQNPTFDNLGTQVIVAVTKLDDVL